MFYAGIELSIAAIAAIQWRNYLVYSDADGLYVYDLLADEEKQELLYDSAAVTSVLSLAVSNDYVYGCDGTYIYKINMRTLEVTYRRTSAVLDIGVSGETLIGADSTEYIRQYELGSMNQLANNTTFKNSITNIDIVRKRGLRSIVWDGTAEVLAVKPITTGRKIEYEPEETVVGIYVDNNKYHIITNESLIVLDDALQVVDTVTLAITPTYAAFNENWTICTATKVYLYKLHAQDQPESGDTVTPQQTDGNLFAFGADSGQFKTSVSETVKVEKVVGEQNSEVIKI